MLIIFDKLLTHLKKAKRFDLIKLVAIKHSLKPLIFFQIRVVKNFLQTAFQSFPLPLWNLFFSRAIECIRIYFAGPNFAERILGKLGTFRCKAFIPVVFI